MPTTVLFIGDPHFQVNNMPEVELFMEKIINLATEKQPDRIVIAGDILHTHERLHTLALNKAYELVDNMRLIAKTYVLVGNHDYCLGKDVPVLLWDSSVKMSQEIKVGDILIGDDGLPRNVINTHTGISQLYRVQQLDGDDYIVTENHTLSLKCGFHKSIFWNTPKKCWVIKWLDKLSCTLKSKLFAINYRDPNCYSRYISRTIEEAREAAENFMDAIQDIDIVDITVKKYLQVPKNVRKRLYGYKLEMFKEPYKSRTSINVSAIEQGEYYGFAIDGNHRFLLGDFTVTHNCNNQQFLTDNHWMNGMKEWNNTIVVDNVISETINEEKFVFVPYVPPGRFEEALNTLRGKWQDASCIFAHQEFAGCKMGAIISVEGDKWSLENPYVVSGHIHSRQVPQKNIYYSGSAMQHAFGESEKNIIAYLTISGINYECEEIDLKLPRKKIVYMDVEDIDNYEVPKTEDTIKVTVSGNYDEFKALKKTKKYKNLLEQGVKVVFKAKKLNKTKKEINKEGEEVDIVDEVQSSGTDFKAILGSIITDQKNPYLLKAYELIVNGKEMGLDDVIFL